ncbi:MAG: hypothetical protein UX91_C0015G0004 [Candidatus Amesbacteria bacterium GW2011_GWB1_47_19]|nr:MAG: hypothetical protein UX91_C0015G0004 [Candidatus Amesbacteria bacterium GW2011_GWB1_47_19]
MEQLPFNLQNHVLGMRQNLLVLTDTVTILAGEVEKMRGQVSAALAILEATPEGKKVVGIEEASDDKR